MQHSPVSPSPEENLPDSPLAASSNIAENFARLQQSLLQPIPGLSNYRFAPNQEPPSPRLPFESTALLPDRPSAVPADRSLPNRNVSHDTIADAYFQFILYCNPCVPSDAKPDELISAFKCPPKSDGKAFDIFVLYQLISQLDQGHIKTWTKLAQDLGVERKDEQSPQKVQQYAVRLKRWMHAMHIDSFFEYCLGKPHNYYLEIPDAHQTGVVRDGVPLEEDLALRALQPESRPKRGRRRTDDLTDDLSQKQQEHDDNDDEEEDDDIEPEKITTGGSSQWAQNLANWTALPETKPPPPKRKRRHGPQVSSAWSTTSSAPAGARPRGRPPGTKNRLHRPTTFTPSPAPLPEMLNTSTPDLPSRHSPKITDIPSPPIPLPAYIPQKTLFHSQDATLKASLVSSTDLTLEQASQVHQSLAKVLDDTLHAAPAFNKHDLPLGLEDSSNSVFSGIANLLACGELIDVNLRPVQMGSLQQAIAGATHFLSFRIRQGGLLMSFSHQVVVGDSPPPPHNSPLPENELEQLRKRCAYLETKVAKSDGQLERLRRDVFQSVFS